MFNHDAGHTHGPTPHFVTGCPLCDAAKNARNQAIAHFAEALHLLSDLDRHQGTPTIRVNIAPIGLTGDDAPHCHSIDLTAKRAEALADAIDSMNAYLSCPPAEPVDALHAVTRESIPTGEWSAAAVAQNDPDLYADVTDLFDSIDPISLLDDVLKSDLPEEAAAAYEQMTGEWDGEL
ncbi:hypothetical protein ACIRNU_34695 [Streptomyces rochei]|uniref:hypothetical protein n=1 Tax=Streptomyces rochei TaxID=1928 RepID=UPI0037FA0E6F